MSEYPIHGSKYFDVREWVDRRTWEALGPKAAWLVDPKIIAVFDLLRELAGVPVTVNNWHFERGGLFDSSGYRAIWDTTGGRLSQHRSGRAGDAKIKGMEGNGILQIVNANKEAFLKAGLTTVENTLFTKTWLHLDVRPKIQGANPEDGFLIVDP